MLSLYARRPRERCAPAVDALRAAVQRAARRAAASLQHMLEPVLERIAHELMALHYDPVQDDYTSKAHGQLTSLALVCRSLYEPATRAKVHALRIVRGEVARDRDLLRLLTRRPYLAAAVEWLAVGSRSTSTDRETLRRTHVDGLLRVVTCVRTLHVDISTWLLTRCTWGSGGGIEALAARRTVRTLVLADKRPSRAYAEPRGLGIAHLIAAFAETLQELVVLDAASVLLDGGGDRVVRPLPHLRAISLNGEPLDRGGLVASRLADAAFGADPATLRRVAIRGVGAIDLRAFGLQLRPNHEVVIGPSPARSKWPALHWMPHGTPFGRPVVLAIDDERLRELRWTLILTGAADLEIRCAGDHRWTSYPRVVAELLEATDALPGLTRLVIGHPGDILLAPLRDPWAQARLVAACQARGVNLENHIEF